MNRAGKFRWLICALLFFVCTVNYMDRQVLGLLKPDLSRKFGWTETEYAMMAIFFQFAYAIGQLGFGSFMNRVGVKTAYGLSVLFWGLAAMSHAAVRTVGGFCGVRLALGLGESGNFPAAIRVVTEWFPPKERSVATGIFNTGSNAGAIFAPLLVPLIVAAFGGWRAAFITLGCLDLVWLVFWFKFYDAPEKSSGVSAEELAHIHNGVSPTASEKMPWLELMRYREAWAYFTTCILGPVWWFYGFWLPDFFNKQFHLDLKSFGLPLAFVALSAAMGSIVGGGLSALFLRRGWSLNRARKTATFICALCTLPVISAPYVSSPWLAAATFGLAGAAHQGWSATMYSVVGDIFPKDAVASVVGFGGMLASFLSMGFFYLVGHVLQGEGTYKFILLVCGSAYLVAWTLFHIGVPRIAPVEIKSFEYADRVCQS
jgi:MFS transporter, ACS family, hexuronate transporter